MNNYLSSGTTTATIDNDLLTFFITENFISLYEKQTFCDILVFSKWQVARIVLIQADYIQIQYLQTPSLPNETLPITSDRIAYFRTHTKPDCFLSKLQDDFNTNLNPLTVLNNIQSVIKENFAYEGYAAHKVLQYWRGRLYYQLDFIFGTHYDSKELSTCFMIIEAYIKMLSKYFKLLGSDHMKGYIAIYEHNKASCLVSWQCALVSFYEDAIVLLKRIFMFKNHDSFYMEYSMQLIKIVELRYKDKERNGIGEELKLIRICKDNWYDAKIKVKMSDNEPIAALIYAYLTDYFYMNNGYENLFDLIIASGKDSVVSFQFLFALFNLMQYITLGIKDSVFSKEYRYIKESIYGRVYNMNDIDIKENHKDIVISVIKKLVNWLKIEQETKKLLFDDMILVYFYRCFICKTLEKQVMAINFFNNLIEHLNKSQSKSQSKSQASFETNSIFIDKEIILHKVDNEKLVALFKDQKIIDNILNLSNDDRLIVHDEVMKRCGPILLLMYRYKWGINPTIQNSSSTIVVHSYNTYIFGLLWRYVNVSKSTDISKMMEHLLCDMMEYATDADKKYLYKMISDRIDIKEMICKEDLVLLRDFTEKSLMFTIEIDNGNELIDDYSLKEHKMLYGLGKLWEYLQDDYFMLKPKDIAKEIIMTTVDNMIFLLNNYNLHINDKTRESIIHSALMNISKGHSCVQYLLLIKGLYTSSTSNTFLYPKYLKILKAFDSNKALFPNGISELIINDLKRYLLTISPNTNSNASIDSIIYEGYFPHSTNITIRLEVILLITSKDKDISFPFKHFNDLWSTSLILTSHYQYQFLFYKILQENISNIDYILLDNIFNEILLNKSNFIIDTIEAYQLFKATFFEVNLRYKNLIKLSSGAIGNDYSFRVDIRLGKDTELIGMNRLWLLLKESINDIIQEECAVLLSEICLNTKQCNETALPYWSSFVSRLIDEMTNAIELSSNKDKEKESEVAIKGLLILIQKLFLNIGNAGIISQVHDTSYLKQKFITYTFKSLSTIIKLPIGNLEPMHIVRFRLSNTFNIPVNRITLYQEPITANLNQDFELFTKIFPMNNINANEDNNIITVIDASHPIIDLKHNPKNLIINQQVLINALIKLLYTQKEGRSYIECLWKLIKNWPINEEIYEMIKALAITSIENDHVLLEMFNRTNVFLMHFILKYIETVIKRESHLKEWPWIILFSKGILIQKIKENMIQMHLNNIACIEEYDCLLMIIDTIDTVLQYNNHIETNTIIIRLIEIIHELFESVDSCSYNNNIIDQVKEREAFLIDHILLFIQHHRLWTVMIKMIMTIPTVNQHLIWIITKGYMEKKNKAVKSKFLQMIINLLMNDGECCVDLNDRKMFLEHIMTIMINREHMDFIINSSNSDCNEDYFTLISKVIEVDKKYTLSNKDYEGLAREMMELIDSQRNIGGYLNVLYAIIANSEVIVRKILKEYNVYRIIYEGCLFGKCCDEPVGKESVKCLTEKMKAIAFDILGVMMYIDDDKKEKDDGKIVEEKIENGQSHTKANIKTNFSQEEETIVNKSIEPINSIEAIEQSFPSSIDSSNNNKISFKAIQSTILTNLHKFHSISNWRTPHIPNWNLSYTNNTKHSYVGIKNLGCTCYMNSIFQLFFMIPPLCNTLLTIPTSSSSKNSLYQLKKILASLKLYESQYCDALSFCLNVDDRVLDVREQMDIDEFFIFLIEKIENHLTTTVNADLIKHFFEGKSSDELIFKNGCGHHKENELCFYSIQLQVKNKLSVYESLNSVVEGEIMEGDNAIYCQDCNKKLPAIKRQSFKVLPRILSFVLKRFEFDYDAMIRSKLNDYYEFPIELDISKYTTDYLHNKPPTDALYKLKAVVIHNGNSERGHYYLFIREDKGDNWYEFNDINIRPVTLDEVKSAAYGGENFAYHTEGNNKEKILKPGNAYLLFYEKTNLSQCEVYPNVDLTIDSSNIAIDNEILGMINKEMHLYWIQKIIFEPSYHKFVLEIVMNGINSNFQAKEFVIFCNFLSRNIHSETLDFANEVMIIRDNYKPIASNVERFINAGLLKIHMERNHPMMTKVMTIETSFKFLSNFFFNVLLRSKSKLYVAPAVDLMKLCINYNINCALWLIEEFQNPKIINEYLIDNPQFNIKKIIIGIIYSAMLTINDKSKSKINPTLLNLINTIIHLIMSFYDKENNYLYFLLYRFASLSKLTLDYLTITIPFLEFLIEFRGRVRCSAPDLMNYVVFSRRTMKINVANAPHTALGEHVYNDPEQKTKNKNAALFYSENYQLLLLCLLLMNKNKNVKEVLFKLFNDYDFLLTLFEDTKNRQSAYAVSNLLNYACYNYKEITEVIQLMLIRLITSVDISNIRYIMLIFKRFLMKINDELIHYRIKTTLDKYLIMLINRIADVKYLTYHLTFLVKIFTYESLRSYIDFFKDSLRKIIKDIREIILSNNNGQIGEDERRLADVRTKMLDLFKANVRNRRERYDSDVDLTDFRFCIGDFVIHEGNEAMVVMQLDEMVQIEIIDIGSDAIGKKSIGDNSIDGDGSDCNGRIVKEDILQQQVGNKYWVDTDNSNLLLKEKYDEDM